MNKVVIAFVLAMFFHNVYGMEQQKLRKIKTEISSMSSVEIDAHKQGLKEEFEKDLAINTVCKDLYQKRCSFPYNFSTECRMRKRICEETKQRAAKTALMHMMLCITEKDDKE